MVRFLLFLLLMFAGGIGFAVITGEALVSWLALGISVLAVLISLMSAFRAEIFPVDLLVAGGDLVLSPPKTQGDASQIKIALNLSFLNKGYGEDVVEWVGLRMRRLFGIDGEPSARENVVVVQLAEIEVGLVVDEVFGKSQTVIKPLAKFFSKLPGVVGSAILENGRVALILDAAELLRGELAATQPASA